MKETLLQRCQSEAREQCSQVDIIPPYQFMGAKQIFSYTDKALDDLIANTLKQAAETLEGLKKEMESRHDKTDFYTESYCEALTDAQRLLGEDNENV